MGPGLWLVLVCGSLCCSATSSKPDLVVTFDPLDGPKARPVTRAAAGLLNGGPEFGHRFLAPLRMSSYRGFKCFSHYSTLEENGVSNIQCLLPEIPFGDSNILQCKFPPKSLHNTSMCENWPGQEGDWQPWEASLGQIVQQRPGPLIWWDIWNEPDTGFWPGCTQGCTAPEPHWLEVWRRTVLTIRSHDKVGKIVGPSTGGFNFGFLTAFINYTVANGVVPDILCWHEFGSNCCDPEVGTNGSDIPDHHAQMRQWLQQYHPSLVDIPIGHNEIISVGARLWAGATLGYLSGMERAGAVMGVHSNWGESSAPEPSGLYEQCGFEELVTCNDQPPAGNDTSRQPRSTYQVYAAYGNTSGVMLPVSRQCDDADGFASYDTHDPIIQGPTSWLAVGRYQFDPKAPPNRSVTVRLSGIPAALVSEHLTTQVTLARIPNSLQEALPHPIPMGASAHFVTKSAALPGSFDLDLKLFIASQDVWTVRLVGPKAGMKSLLV